MDDVVLITPPANEPVLVGDFKAHARIYVSDEDDYIQNIIIPAARESIETETRRALVKQTWLLKRDTFPGFDPLYHMPGYPAILLPKPPFQSVVSFTYIDTAGVQQTLTQTGPDGVVPLVNGVDPFYGYQLDPGSETQPGRLNPPWARPWPPTRRVPMAVQVQFVAGYGDLVDDGTGNKTWQPRAIPIALQMAIFLQAAHFYENREAISAEGKKELARGVASLIGPYINEIA